MKDEIVEGMSFGEYRMRDGANGSYLWSAYKTSWHHAHQGTRADRMESQSMKIGTAVHTAMLERDEFNDRYVMLPDEFSDMRYKASKEAKKALEEANPGKVVLKATEWDQVFTSAERAIEKSEYRILFCENNLSELSFFWTDPQTGAKCKGRVDSWNPDTGTIIDVKTTGKLAKFDEFRRQSEQLGYYFKAAYYWRGLKALGLNPKKFVWVVVETSDIGDVAFYDLPDEGLMLGNIYADEMLEQYTNCKAEKRWHGYPDESQPLWLSKSQRELLERKLQQRSSLNIKEYFGGSYES